MDRSRQDVTIELSKSIWKERYTRNFQFFCPFCSSPRRLGLHPRPGHPMHFVQVGLTALVLTIVAWPLFGLKGLVSFIPLWITFEVYYRAKVRASVRCGHCGFDPLLYLVDVKRAKQAIREHWEAKRAKMAATSGVVQQVAAEQPEEEESQSEWDEPQEGEEELNSENPSEDQAEEMTHNRE